MTPKSLLRLPEAASRPSDLASGGWAPVVDDPERQTDAAAAAVRRIILCSGKVYYDMALSEERAAAADVALLFSRTAASLDADFEPVARALAPGGMLWVAWPKKASKQPTDLTEDVVRRIGLAAGLVDVKVCAIDDVWSGLKFLRRRAGAT